MWLTSSLLSPQTQRPGGVSLLQTVSVHQARKTPMLEHQPCSGEAQLQGTLLPCGETVTVLQCPLLPDGKQVSSGSQARKWQQQRQQRQSVIRASMVLDLLPRGVPAPSRRVEGTATVPCAVCLAWLLLRLNGTPHKMHGARYSRRTKHAWDSACYALLTWHMLLLLCVI